MGRRSQVGIVALTIVVSSTGCSIFRRAPAPTPAAPPIEAVAPSLTPVEGAAAARAACENYVASMEGALFPRDAIIRGVDTGSAKVRFLVEGSKTTILSVRSSDPAFGAASADVVRRFSCRTERPTTYEVPFTWRSVR